jgi:hypothetical protein
VAALEAGVAGEEGVGAGLGVGANDLPGALFQPPTSSHVYTVDETVRAREPDGPA